MTKKIAFIDEENLNRAIFGRLKRLEERLEQRERALAEACLTIEAQRQEIVALQARVAELEEKLRTNSSNSSKPPSTDPPNTAPKEPKKRGKRKQGGQPGHAGTTRELMPTEEADHVVPCLPGKQCTCGGRVCVDHEQDPERQQKFELPEINPEVTEYQIFSGECIKCGQVHRGELPKGVPDGILGPRAMATVAMFSGNYHLSKRQIEEILADQFGLSVSLGTVSNTEANVSEALEKPVEEAKAFIREQSVVHADETGHKVAGEKAWVWTAVTSFVAVFLVRSTRGTAAAKELLGEAFRGFLVSDRWSAYNWVNAALRQLCWAHLTRDFKKMSERGGRSQEIANQILEHVQEMFVLWHRVKDGKRTRRWFQRKMILIREEVEDLLAQGVICGHPKTQRTCKRILKLKTALWTFVDTVGIEPTNNFAERTIRSYVLWRKMSFGTQSERGNLFVERMMTVTSTCKLQRRNVLDYVTTAIRAHLCGEAVPSLLPESTSAEIAMAA